MEGNSRGLTEGIILDLPAGTEKGDKKNISHDRRCPGLDSNCVSPKLMSEDLPL